MPEQRVVEPEYLILEAPRERKFITGSQAFAEPVINFLSLGASKIYNRFSGFCRSGKES